MRTSLNKRILFAMPVFAALFFLASCSNNRYGYIQRAKGPSVPAIERQTEQQVTTPENIQAADYPAEQLIAPSPVNVPAAVSPVAMAAEPQQATAAKGHIAVARVQKAPETITESPERTVTVERSTKTKAEAQSSLSGDVRLGIILIAVGLIVLILPLGWVGYVVGSILVIVGIVYLLLGLL